jgi:hypothetical protein
LLWTCGTWKGRLLLGESATGFIWEFEEKCRFEAVKSRQAKPESDATTEISKTPQPTFEFRLDSSSDSASPFFRLFGFSVYGGEKQVNRFLQSVGLFLLRCWRNQGNFKRE